MKNVYQERNGLLVAPNRSGEGALAVDIVMRSVATSIDGKVADFTTMRCDRRHKGPASHITSP